MNSKKLLRICAVFMMLFSSAAARAERGTFDMERWDAIMDNVRTRATAQNISSATIKATLRNPAFIPSIVRSDKNQSEFKLTLDQYLARTVSAARIANGKKMRAKYPTMLSRVENKFGVPSHVILAFWGLESNYGEYKAAHNLRDAFLTLMYDGRRETFFGNQLLALMKIADDNNLDITQIRGSWAGAMGHFQFIPTTLAAYGVDGNGDGHIDIIGSVGDAMFSAGNYLSKLGWNPNERIVRAVVVPADFDVAMLKGDVKKSLDEWAALGVSLPDGGALPSVAMTAGLVADTAEIDAANAPIEADMDTDIAPRPVIHAYLTYPNFYRIKKWNNSNWYAIAVATLADALKQQ
ncbi:MAG: lytic murein transglycosylase [Alphaproteobacteria bacterium]|nr:lytic murein transglycosylase [Alphaproteobacteria bacterium]